MWTETLKEKEAKGRQSRDCDVSTDRGPRTVGNTTTWKRQGRVSTWSFWRERGP